MRKYKTHALVFSPTELKKYGLGSFAQRVVDKVLSKTVYTYRKSLLDSLRVKSPILGYLEIQTTIKGA